MKFLRSFLFLFTLTITLTCTMTPQVVKAQCAMCTMNAENSTKNGNMQGKGLNDGILFLLAIPYLAAAGLGFLWYKKFRKKNTVKKQIFADEIK